MKHYKLIETLEVEKMFSEIVTYRLNNLNRSPNGTSNSFLDVEMVKILMSSLFSKLKSINKYLFGIFFIF
jgi:hypothetical protein